MTQHQVNGTNRFVVDPDLSGDVSALATSEKNTCVPRKDLFRHSTGFTRKPSKDPLRCRTALTLITEYNLRNGLFNSFPRSSVGVPEVDLSENPEDFQRLCRTQTC